MAFHGFAKFYSMPGRLFKLHIIDFVFFYLGCASCFVLQAFGLEAIFSAAVLGLLITFIPLPSRWHPRSIQIVFCTGTFVGMSSAQIVSGVVPILLISVLGAVVYILSKPYFQGVGGKMGAIAFVATFIWILARVWT